MRKGQQYVSNRVLDFAVKINILSSEFDFHCLRCIILLRSLYTVRARASEREEQARVTFASAHFFFSRINVLHHPVAGKFSQFMFRPCQHFEYRHLLYIEASVTRNRAVTMIVTPR